MEEASAILFSFVTFSIETESAPFDKGNFFTIVVSERPKWTQLALNSIRKNEAAKELQTQSCVAHALQARQELDRVVSMYIIRYSWL